MEMSKMRNFRHEFKYNITQAEYLNLTPKLICCLQVFRIGKEKKT